MNKGELVERIAKDAKISKTQATKALNSALNGIQGTLKKGGKVTIKSYQNIRGTVRKHRLMFTPLRVKRSLPYELIRVSRPEDDYWAVKILGTITPEHLKLLINEARYPEKASRKLNKY